MLQPLRGKVLVENMSEDSMTKGGIMLNNPTDDFPHKGKVISIGLKYMNKDCKEFNWHFKEGEVVHFKRKWDQNKSTHFILLREDIFAVEGEDGLRAVNDRIIIKRIYTNTIGKSTIIIPETYGVKENHCDYYGLVISEGPDSRFNFLKGDKILYHRNEGSEFKFMGDEYFSLLPRAVMARLED